MSLDPWDQGGSVKLIVHRSSDGQRHYVALAFDGQARNELSSIGVDLELPGATDVTPEMLAELRHRALGRGIENLINLEELRATES